MSADQIPVGNLSVSPQSRRAIEASIAAGTSGAPFWALHAFLFCFIGCLTIVSWGATAWAVVATLSATEAGMEVFGIPFFGFFAVVATIVWSGEIRFLRHALRSRRESQN